MHTAQEYLPIIRSVRRRHSRRGPVGRTLLRAAHRTSERVASRIAEQGSGSSSARQVFARLPWLPARWVPWLRSPARPRTEVVPEPPAELRTVAGIQRDEAAEESAFRARPLHSFFRLHADSIALLGSHLWAPLLAVAPNLVRSTQRLIAAQQHAPHGAPARTDPAELAVALKAEGARLGMSAVGVARYDEKYTFSEYAGRNVGDRVVVCALEQNNGSTQQVPSITSEQAALSTYSEVQDRVVALADWLRRSGFRARPEPFDGESIFIHYGVAAGLGQLGLNGQLLTPHMGSRCRLIVLTTDAPLEIDEPVDYGIEGICDQCQACVQRCPVGAIPARRAEYRGITKAKLNTKRCLPIVTQAAGCSICMKVCPVQAYGLPAVLDEYHRSGRILGKDTDELEGYDWPLDGQHYGPGSKPRVPREVERPDGYPFDANRTEPPPEAPELAGGIAGFVD